MALTILCLGFVFFVSFIWFTPGICIAYFFTQNISSQISVWVGFGVLSLYVYFLYYFFQNGLRSAIYVSIISTGIAVLFISLTAFVLGRNLSNSVVEALANAKHGLGGIMSWIVSVACGLAASMLSTVVSTIISCVGVATMRILWPRSGYLFSCITLLLTTVLLDLTVVFGLYNSGFGNIAIVVIVSVNLLGITLALNLAMNLNNQESRFGFICDLIKELTCANGTIFREAKLVETDFTRSCITTSDFRGARLDHVKMIGVKGIESAAFDQKSWSLNHFQQLISAGSGQNQKYTGLDFRAMVLTSANLRNADLRECDLQDCNLDYAELQHAKLDRANLRGASLRDVEIQNTSISEATIDYMTYVNSNWSPSILDFLRSKYVQVFRLEAFPDALQEIYLQRYGLSLYFNIDITPVTQELIQKIINVTLGNETDCKIAEYRKIEKSASILIRLTADNQDNLIMVAESIYRKTWESNKREKSTLLALSDPATRNALSSIRKVLSKMKLVSRVDGDLQIDSTATKIEWDLDQDQIIGSAREVNLYISYSDQDGDDVRGFLTHLTVLKKQNQLFNFYSYDQVAPGEKLSNSIESMIESSEIYIAMISSNYLSNDLCLEQINKMKEKAKFGSRFVIPVILRPVLIKGTPVDGMKQYPSLEYAISQSSDKDAAWSELVSQIRMRVLSIQAKSRRPPKQNDR